MKILLYHSCSPDGVCNFKNWSDFIIGISWPVVVLFIVIYFKDELRSIIKRLKSFKGAEFETATGSTEVQTTGTTSVFSTMEKKILKTLWHYQRVHFPSGADNKRWSFFISKESTEYPQFRIAIENLVNKQYVTINLSTGQYYLTNDGMEYCRNNETSLGDDYFTGF